MPSKRSSFRHSPIPHLVSSLDLQTADAPDDNMAPPSQAFQHELAMTPSPRPIPDDDDLSGTDKEEYELEAMPSFSAHGDSSQSAAQASRKKVPGQSPVAHRIAAQPGARVPQDAEERYFRFAEEAQRYIIGPMPVEEFLDFLPHADRMPKCKGAFDKVKIVKGREPDMYPQLIKAIENRRICPTVKFVNTSTVGQDRGQGEMKPDVSGFDIQISNQLDRIKNQKSRLKGKRFRANLSRSEITFDLKLKIDPFCDDANKSFLRWPASRKATDAEKKRKAAFGQVTCYAVTQCARQHRVFLFSVMTIGSCARLFRWDRAGIVVTHSFDFKKNPELLCEFLWRFSNATPAQRGYDPTVTIATDDEETFFKNHIAEEVAFQLNIDSSEELFAKAMKRHYEKQNVAKVKVFNDEGAGPEVIDCLISIPVAAPRSVTGRGTRGYWAVILTGPKRGEVVFLKDIWRVDVSEQMLEGKIYDEMMENDVENIANKLYGGDVLYEESEGLWVGSGSVQTSQSQEYISASWLNKTLKCYGGKEDDLHVRVFKHTHYRMILNEVGYPLREFTGSRELFHAVRDVVYALISAYEKSKRLHRDVSIGNIILVRYRDLDRRKGILVDWEFSVKTDRKGFSLDYTRSGTWPFMSVEALKSRDRGFQHTRSDDFESVLYVLIYASVHWLPHNYGQDLGAWIQGFFYDYHAKDGEQKGGNSKSAYIQDADFKLDFQFSTPGIDTFFANMYNDLWLASFNLRAHGVQTTWTADNIVTRFNNVCYTLAVTPTAARDRVVNDTSDAPLEIEPEPRATQTSSRLVSEAGSSRAAGDLVDESKLRGSKRTTRDNVLAGLDNSDTAGGSKRKRFELSDGGSESNSILELRPPPMRIQTRPPIHQGAPKDELSASNRSRQMPRQSLPKILGKDSNLSSKSSNSSLRHVREARSGTSTSG